MPVVMGNCFKCATPSSNKYGPQMFACPEHAGEALVIGQTVSVTPPTTQSANVNSNAPPVGQDIIPAHIVATIDGQKVAEVPGKTEVIPDNPSVSIDIYLSAITGKVCPVCEGDIKPNSKRHMVLVGKQLA